MSEIETQAAGTAPAESVETPAAAPAEPASLLGSAIEQPAAQEQAAEEQPSPVGFDVIPENLRVMNAEGHMDYLASTQKLAEAYGKLSAYGRIPGEDEDYSPVEGLAANWDEIKELDAVKNFAAEAKKLGMTDQQFGFALQHISAAERDGRNFAAQATREEGEKKLRELWSEPETFNLNLRQAATAMNTLVPEADRNEFGVKYGNDPVVIQLLAKIGAELSEDIAVGIIQPVPSMEDVQTLMRSEAYRNSDHPEHKAIAAKVARYYEKTYGTDAVL